MARNKNQQHQLDTDALISVNQATFQVILNTPENRLVDTLHALIKKGHLIIWNPSREELISDGDIEKATIVGGSTVKLTLSTKKVMDLQQWLDT
ncbi:hypothetical protein KKI24_03915 [bacterium]|nr:hypothetical protein [bacterium]